MIDENRPANPLSLIKTIDEININIYGDKGTAYNRIFFAIDKSRWIIRLDV